MPNIPPLDENGMIVPIPVPTSYHVGKAETPVGPAIVLDVYSQTGMQRYYWPKGMALTLAKEIEKLLTTPDVVEKKLIVPPNGQG